MAKIIIYQADEASLQKVSDILSQCYSHQMLSETTEEYAYYLKKQGYTTQDTGDSTFSAKIDQIVKINGHNSIKDNIFLWANILGHPKNRADYFAHFSEEEQEIWHRLVYNNFISCQSIPEHLRNNLIGNSIERTYTKKWLAWGIIYSRYDYFLYNKRVEDEIMLPSPAYALFFPMVEPQFSDADFIHQAELTEDEKAHVLTFESYVPLHVSILLSLFQQGSFKTTLSKLVAKGSLKKMEMMNFRQFGQPQQKDPFLRNRMLLAAPATAYTNFPSTASSSYPSSKPQKVMRYALKEMTKESKWLHSVILNDETIRKSEIEASTFPLLAADIVDLLKKYPDTWIDADNVPMKIISNTSQNCFHLGGFSNPELGRTTTLFNQFTGHEIDNINKVPEQGLPMLFGFLAMLLSWGCIEVVCRPLPNDATTDCQFIKLFRTTKLGRYVLGIDQTYTIGTLTNGEQLFEVGKMQLIVRSTAKDNPFEPVVAQMANHIGNGRYEVTATSLLAGCKNKEDVKRRIDSFKGCVGKDLPRIWNDFFADILQHCNPFKSIDCLNYYMYQIDKDNINLQRLLTTDPELSSYILRAEDFVILIQSNKHTDFVNRLKNFGYLL